jgi:hypothetical protein
VLDELVGDGRHVAGGSAGGDDHVVGKRAFAVEIDRQDILGFGVIEGG